MDPTDLRAGLAEKLSGDEPIDAQTFNAACFMLTRALEDLKLTVAEAAPLTRRLLRAAGRVVIDTGLAESSADAWPNTEEMVLLWIDQALRELGYRVRPTADGGRPELKPAGEDWGGRGPG
jgi:hypothetical protein